MSLFNRRIALLTGASVTTLGLAAPAMAATTVSPGMSHIVGPAAVVTDTLTICDLGDTCFFGVEATNSPVAVAFVSTPANGQIEQIGLGGDVDLLMINLGDAEIAAHANATATVGNATAGAVIGSAVLQSGIGTGDVALSFANSGTLLIDATANATAETGNAQAFAYIGPAIAQFASAIGTGSASAQITNTGSITVAADGQASGNAALVSVVIGSALFQQAAAEGIASVGLNNSGVLTISANASATGASAFAKAAVNPAIYQIARGAEATIDFDNSGTIEISASANAFATTGAALAFVEAPPFFGGLQYGIRQFATGTSAEISFHNSGDIIISAVANAVGEAAAIARIGQVGITQLASVASAGTVSLSNEGAINVSALLNATAEAAFGNRATAYGIFQVVGAGLEANLSADNSGSIDVVASGVANGEIRADVGVNVLAVLQTANASNVAKTIDNSGTIAVVGNATAVASGMVTGLTGEEVLAGGGFANAVAVGLNQNGAGAVVEQSMTNSGTIDIVAQAFASAPAAAGPDGTEADGRATAFALAIGVVQFNVATATAIESFTNSGSLNVNAVATAAAAFGSATAAARGAQAFGGGQAPLTVAIANSGDINATATAVANGRAYALARAIHVNNAPATAPGTGTGTSSVLVGTPVNGAITNSGSINAAAFASGETFTTVIGTGSTQATFTFGGSSAFATAIAMFGGVNNMTINNSGSITVDAVSADGDTAIAMGIVALTNAPAVSSPTDVFTINNSGDIIVRQSTDGGETWQRGLAINVAGNPANNVFGVSNQTVVNLLGGGNIYGNIAIQDGDVINVTDGETVFDGVITPGCLPAEFAGGDSPALSSCGVGDLNIVDGGTLVLRDPRLTGDPAMYDGPAYAFVETLTLDSSGTIAFELQPAAGGDQPAGSYPQVFAEVANLDGTLEARFTPAGGLLADSYFYDNVIDANVRNGTFDQCVIGGGFANSLLVDAGCVYDSQANVDLAITRTAFDAVAGLNQNGTSVGFGLECVYDVNLTGPIVDLFADLFLFTDPVNYNIALNQLSGSVYANYLQSFPSLGVHYNDLLAKATDCEIPALAGSALECRAGGPIHVWGQLDYQWRKADGDDEAGTLKSRRFTGLLGIDANVATSAVIGVSAGYVTNNARDNQFGDDIDGDGMQVGLYGVYDPGLFYVKAMTTYSWLKGESDRNINFAGLAPGATFAASPTGDPDVNMWTFGLHGGYRLGMGGNSVLTPYLNYDYVNAKLKGFTETGGNGADLTVYGGRAKHSFLTAGVKWATQMGGVVPEVNLGYRHRFGEKRSDFRAAFLGDEDCAFDIISAAQKRGSFLAGLSVGGKMGPVDLRIGYEGEFNSDVTSHSGNFKFVIPLGGRAAPPPQAPLAPPVVAPPPPPEPVEVAPPPPPPPPPAPVERGERG